MELLDGQELPYYAVIFTSVLSDREQELYAEMNDRLVREIKNIKGYLGHESARSEVGITVVYFEDLSAIDKWRKHEGHVEAKSMGKSEFYDAYSIRICKVESHRFWSR